MKFSLSRRGFLVGFSGGAASASLGWGAWERYRGAPGLKDAYPVTPCCTYVDHNGWLLTRADKDRLTSTESGPSR
jgi:hypothetical protein